MSGIRKYKRRKAARKKQKKTARKMSLWEVLMIVGGAMVLLGVFVGVLCYAFYIGGRPEQFLDSPEGMTYHPEEAPGDPGRKAMAYAGFAIAGVGSLLVLFSTTAYLVDRRLKRSADETAEP